MKCCCLYLVLQMLKYYFECSCDFEGKKASMIFKMLELSRYYIYYIYKK